MTMPVSGGCTGLIVCLVCVGLCVCVGARAHL
jgi:hypothetical protein